MEIGRRGNVQATTTGDAGGTATTLAVFRAHAVHSGGPVANRMTEIKLTTAPSLIAPNVELTGGAEAPSSDRRERG